MSSGPSRRKLNPRRASSSCGEETPRSRRSPSTFPTSCISLTIALSCANSSLISSSRRSSRNTSGTDAIACGSRSIAINRPFAFNRSRIALLCPPRPNVPSTYVPSAFILSPSRTGPSSTGTCSLLLIRNPVAQNESDSSSAGRLTSSSSPNQASRFSIHRSSSQSSNLLP